MSQNGQAGLFRRIVGYVAGWSPERSTPQTVESQARNAWNFNQEAPYPNLEAVDHILQRADRQGGRPSNAAIRLSKRKRDQDAVLEEFQCMDTLTKKRRVIVRDDPDAVDDANAPEADFAIRARKRSMSLYQGLRTHWTCMVSLSALFKRQQELTGGTSVLPHMGKRILAVVLATALLPFLETPWVQPTFNHSNIQFFQPLGEDSLPDITKPFLDMKRVPIALPNRAVARENEAEMDTAKHMVHPNASVLALGILLCELHYCKPIEAWQDDPDASQTVNSTYYTSLEVLKDLEVDAGMDYYLATKACLQWEYLPAGEHTAFESASVQKLFYQNVVKRLESEIPNTWLKGLENLQSLSAYENQRCWGKNGCEVIRQHTARRESVTKATSEPPAYVEPYEVFMSHGGTPRAASGIDGLVRIAILDSGFDPTHPLLRTDEGNIDPRIKGFQNFVAGRDAQEYQDEIGHGTHALGLLLKVATCAEIYIARIANQATLGRDSYSAISKAINHAVSVWEVDVISMSFGIREFNEDMKEAILNARHKQTLMFAAASNDGANHGRAFPAKDRGVFCIHSSDGNGYPSRFNPIAEEDDVNFCLLGENVESHWPVGTNGHNSNFRVLSGTSVATPIAAGLAASLLSLVRQQEQDSPTDPDRLGRWLKDFDSMETVLKSITKGKRGAGYDYIVPHFLSSMGSSREDIYTRIKQIKGGMFQ
ncbi:hypothetical protein IL306_007785 [Fusarium sp. DS 682]|nr:hypothetical protein IL306_007785 [Fusarium sp. DS 682]